jgi:hypothetical protein
MLENQQIDVYPLPSSTPAVVPYSNLINSSQVSQSYQVAEIQSLIRKRLNRHAVCEEQLSAEEKDVWAIHLRNRERGGAQADTETM